MNKQHFRSHLTRSNLECKKYHNQKAVEASVASSYTTTEVKIKLPTKRCLEEMKPTIVFRTIPELQQIQLKPYMIFYSVTPKKLHLMIRLIPQRKENLFLEQIIASRKVTMSSTWNQIIIVFQIIRILVLIHLHLLLLQN